MAWMKLFVMFLFVTLIFTTNTQAFDAYLVAAQWPPAVCRSSNACQNPIRGHSFTVHGVWPTPPKSSSLVKFKSNDIPDDQKAALNRIWPDLKGGNNEKFWEHEWDNHGVFSGLSQVEYFWKCLQLWKIGNVDGRLANAGIVTSNTPILINNTCRPKATAKELYWST
ncbi:hypothetical protein TSUD_420550 [Trifolium subterraneum]|uniref:Uncharacterized protein n=1 Tax=Trifolium subterraneum TaxID=3900 RepID=A0A1B5Z8D5_TRISU|nr:hypothetical protein TSUD_420550 [Trifolium subterraneum]